MLYLLTDYHRAGAGAVITISPRATAKRDPSITITTFVAVVEVLLETGDLADW